MHRFSLFFLIAPFLSFSVYCQNDSLSSVGTLESVSDKPAPSKEPVYKLRIAADIPITAAGMAWSAYAFPKIYDKDPSTAQQINALRISDINGFDRWAADKYSEKADKTSDIFFYSSMPLPLLLLIDRDIRKDAAKIGFLYLEALSITGIFYTGSAYVFDRYRPQAYNVSAPMDVRMSGNSKNSFLAGHPALVATSTFFIASVYAGYHPDSDLRWVLYGGAILATGTTAYLRHIAGKHFPSDLLTGIAVGTLSGTLVPHFHKNKLLKNKRLSITPFSGQSHGLAMRYKL